MSDTQVAALEHSIQQTNIWLKKLAEDQNLGDRHQAYNALRAVLHVLRDRLTPEQAVHLGAQLPIMVRGIYYEGWRIAGKPSRERTPEDFAAEVEGQLPPQFPLDARSATEAVFDLLWQELDPGEIAKIIGTLPVPLRSLWPTFSGL
jgi:uncharacterized protein (DUF2267 family)